MIIYVVFTSIFYYFNMVSILCVYKLGIQVREPGNFPNADILHISFIPCGYEVGLNGNGTGTERGAHILHPCNGESVGLEKDKSDL